MPTDLHQLMHDVAVQPLEPVDVPTVVRRAVRRRRVTRTAAAVATAAVVAVVGAVLPTGFTTSAPQVLDGPLDEEAAPATIDSSVVPADQVEASAGEPSATGTPPGGASFGAGSDDVPTPTGRPEDDGSADRPAGAATHAWDFDEGTDGWRTGDRGVVRVTGPVGTEGDTWVHDARGRGGTAGLRARPTRRTFGPSGRETGWADTPVLDLVEPAVVTIRFWYRWERADLPNDRLIVEARGGDDTAGDRGRLSDRVLVLERGAAQPGQWSMVELAVPGSFFAGADSPRFRFIVDYATDREGCTSAACDLWLTVDDVSVTVA